MNLKDVTTEALVEELETRGREENKSLRQQTVMEQILLLANWNKKTMKSLDKYPSEIEAVEQVRENAETIINMTTKHYECY